MTRLTAALALLPLSAMLSACANSAPPPRPYVERDGKPYQFTADPGALVAQDIAFQRAIRKDGFAKAAKDYAAGDAQFLINGRMPLDAALKSGVSAQAFVKTDTLGVVMSCDGHSAAVITRGIDANGKNWGMLTIWNMAPNSQWRWSMLMIAKQEVGALPEDSVVQTSVAKCGTKPPAAFTAPAVGVDMQIGYSPDQTLSWTSLVKPDGTAEIIVKLWDGAEMEEKVRVFTL